MERENIPEEIKNRINELKERIANREAMIAARGDQLSLNKFEELKKWKEELKELENNLEIKSEKKDTVESKTVTDNLTESENDKEDETDKENGFEGEEPEDGKENETEENETEEDEPEGDKPEEEKDELKDLPQLNLKLNMKTGECILIDTENDKSYERKIESRYYTKEALKSQEKFISENFEIDGEGKKYLKNIDPTILNSYLIYDKENDGKYNDSAARMYIEAVLNRAQKLAHGEPIDEEVSMPGKIEIDLRKNKEQKDLREDDEKFKSLKGLLAKFRARKILENHGEDRMNLAKVLKDRTLNRLKFILGFGAISASLLAGGSHYIKNQVKDKHPQNNRDVFGEQFPGRENYTINHNDLANKENDNSENEKIKNSDSENNVTDKNNLQKNNSENNIIDKDTLENENSQKDESNNNSTIIQNQTSRINLGDIVTPEQYSLLYKSADSMNPAGAIGSSNRILGVNKLACVIDGKTYSTKDYSADEIYQMAENAGVEVKCHLDEAAVIDGKNCVQVKEVGNPSPTYIYYENGAFKYLDGREFTGDVESGIGWVNLNDCEKSELKQQVNNQNNNQENARKSVENDIQK